MAVSQVLTVTSKPAHLVVELASPTLANRLTAEVVDQLTAALDKAETDADCRAFVLTAAGNDFCSGADLKEFAQSPGGEAAAKFSRLLDRLATTPVVTIAVVEKQAIGGGAGLAAACDIVVAGPEASFRLTEVCFGMLPTIIMPAIARRLGEHRALRTAILAEEVSAHDAVKTGWADQVVEDPRAAVRPILLALRRSERDTIADLKEAHRVLFPVDNRYAKLAERVFGARVNQPDVVASINSFAAKGML
ncbi:enoyl-CoA hydratase/isomerase family protein [Saccharopolyspora spinosa]|uniref:Polyketide biosynthesis enoyl-CoA hydratase PksH n=1 Tax=Saccharopolyspora spinosa TaxID=60894 RepID=A0A2N3Y5E5_SACSN|nr:enoyl-CoA hydratase/isomerase family protein [Saccharopolyspora spinosa]PKW18140.1 polyketide biosynthesis enoyl-CoA hydratase PksH [Saccharopolyspora spinosa]